MGNLQAFLHVMGNSYLREELEISQSQKLSINIPKSNSILSIFNFRKEFHQKGESIILKNNTTLRRHHNSSKLNNNQLQSIPEIEIPSAISTGESESTFIINFNDNIDTQELYRYDGGNDGALCNWVTANDCFPNSITPQKIAHWFMEELRYEIPFIDDLSFFDGDWYCGSGNIWMYIPDCITMKDNSNIAQQKTPLDIIIKKKIHEHISPFFMNTKTKNIIRRKLCSCFN